MNINHLLISGKPGVGKTTLIEKLVRAFKSNYEISGFWTVERRRGKQRIGFDIQALSGKTGILARTDSSNLRSRFRVGKYFVSTKDLEEIAVPELYSQSDLTVIDEIGKMELFSSKFKKAVLYALDNKPFVLATIGYQKIDFLNAIKTRPDVELLEITTVNRDFLFQNIEAKIRKALEKADSLFF